MRSIFFVIIFLILQLSGCASDSQVYAPVLDASIESLPKHGTYRVRHDDTLYSIAWRYGLDYRYLAKVNHISPPYHIEPSQLLYLRHATTNKKRHAPKMPRPHHIEREPTAAVSQWLWPATGPVVRAFSELNKGINISGHMGAPVYATAPGKVVYSGNGLRAYGNLIIIKHNSLFLSAYAYNNKVLVKEGDWVTGGQKIAEIGSNAHHALLHFEIRRSGKPVNPLSYLGRR
ncbi:MAG: peptidoglycan DD-metalloendopeptidase family protein [Gammaproteobacteria bacterium]